MVETKAPCCLNVFRRACLADSSHPVCVTGPFIFSFLRGAVSPVASEFSALLWWNLRHITAVHATQPSSTHTHTHTHDMEPHMPAHTSSPRGLWKTHMSQLLLVLITGCSSFLSPYLHPDSSSSSSESLGHHVLFPSPPLVHLQTGSSEAFRGRLCERSLPGGDYQSRRRSGSALEDDSVSLELHLSSLSISPSI